MKPSDVAIVTITLARSKEEEEALLRSLEKLASTGLPLVIADGGSGRQFVKQLPAFTNYVVVPDEKGLVPQIKSGIAATLRQFPDKRAILYTEPDKYLFFEGRLIEFITAVRDTKRFGVAVAARSGKSFRTFPQGQYKAESFMNEAFSWIVSTKGDYCYGPLLLARRAAEMALDAPNDLGWGWRFWTMRRAHSSGLRIVTVQQHLPCPTEQRGEDSPKDRIYRLKQLKQNLKAVTLPEWDRVPNPVLEERKRHRR